MAFITSSSVSVQNGSKTVSVSGNVDLSSVDEGWAVQIGANKLVEASSGTAPNSSGVSTLTLFEPWQNGNVTAATMEIIPNSGYQIALAKRIKSIVDRTVDVMQLQHDYASKLGQVTATDPETNEQHVYNTLRQNQSEIDALLESFGTAAGYDVTSSTTDTGNGANGKPKLLRVGDGGILGNPIPIASGNLDSVIVPGVYAVSSGTIGNPTNDNGVLIVSLRAANRIHHRFLQLGGQNFVGEYERVSYGSMLWSPFEKVLTTGNTGTAVGYDVTSNATDKTPNRLLKVGDFGLGVGGLYGVFGLDLNNYIETGVYRNSSHANWNNSTNKPPSIATALNQTFVLTVDRNQSSALTQMLHVESNRFFIRARNITDTWTPWREVLHTGNTGIQPSTSGNTLIGTTTDNGLDKLQVNGGVSIAGAVRFLTGSGQFINESTHSVSGATGAGILVSAFGDAPTSGELYVVEIDTNKYLNATFYKQGASNNPIVTVLASNGLSLGSANPQGTQNILGFIVSSNVRMMAKIRKIYS